MTVPLIVCRAKVSKECYDGRPTSVQFGGALPMSEDGTWVPDEDGPGSIVCDPCYIRLMPYTPSGQALNEELPAAIEQARAAA